MIGRQTFYLNRRDDVRAGLRMDPDRQKQFWRLIRRRGYIMVFDHYHKRNDVLPVRVSNNTRFLEYVRQLPNSFVWNDRRSIYRSFLARRIYGRDSLRTRIRLQRLERFTHRMRAIRRRPPPLDADALRDVLRLDSRFNHRRRNYDYPVEM